MASTVVLTRSWVIHPFHAAVLGGVLPLFLGALLADYAYWSSYEIQWANFASWLLIGAMVMTTLALLCGLIGLVRGSRNGFYVIVLAVTWIPAALLPSIRLSSMSTEMCFSAPALNEIPPPALLAITLS